MWRFLGIVAGLALAGVVALWVFTHLLTLVFYVIVGALVVGGGVYLYGRARRALTTGRNQKRIEAAYKTYESRNR